MINLYGKGEHAKAVKFTLENHPQKVFYCNLFNDDDYDSSLEDPWIVAIGNNKDRKKIANTVLKGKKFTMAIADQSICKSDPGIGSMIMYGAVIQGNVKIGNHCIINTSASIDHDCIIEDFCHIGPNSTLCGNVHIGEGTLIGAGSVIIPGIKIGKNCIIGAGSVVTKNIEDGKLAYGNPAKIK